MSIHPTRPGNVKDLKYFLIQIIHDIMNSILSYDAFLRISKPYFFIIGLSHFKIRLTYMQECTYSFIVCMSGFYIWSSFCLM